MNIEDITPKIDDLIRHHESARDFCETAYLDDVNVGKLDSYKWRNTKKYWSEKIVILQDIKDLIQEYKNVEPR